MSEIWAINDGTIETKVPDENPKTAAKTMIGTLPCAGIQRARTTMAEKKVVIVMMLNRPSISPR